MGSCIRLWLRAGRERYAHVPAVGYAQSPNEWRVGMNSSTRSSLYAMRKDELVEFAWKMVNAYNESQRQRIYAEEIIAKLNKETEEQK